VRPAAILLAFVMVVPAAVPSAMGQTTKALSDNAQMPAVAVARTESGELVGSTAQVSVSVATNGSGNVFVDTHPLTGADMQGSARIASRVAASMTGYDLAEHDFHFVVRSNSPTISGPSAGSVMGMAATVALQNLHREEGQREWTLSEDVFATGTISPDGTIGPVGGIVKKAEAAANAGGELFLFPQGQSVVRPTSIENGQLSAGDPVNVPEYCESELGIECRGVGRLQEAVRLSTGFAFEHPEVGDPPSTAEYEERLAPLADRLIERADRAGEVRERLEQADLSDDQREQVTAAVEEAERWQRRAERLVDRSNYYSASSRAFSAGINARHADLLLEYYESGRQVAVVEDAIANASQGVDEVRGAAGNATVEGIQSLYTVGAAQARVSDAEQRLAQARAQLNETEMPSALRSAARAVERASTVTWWLQLDDAFGGGPELPTPIEEIAGDLLDLSREIVAYSAQAGGGQQPESAVQELQQARRDHDRGFHAAAAIEAAQAQVLATLSLEIRGTVSDEKVLDGRDSAQKAIETARSRGVQPLLPIAYFEFAAAQDARPGAVQFYRFAETLAGLTSVLSPQSEPASFEYVGAYEGHGGFDATPRSVTVGWFTVGALAALTASLFVLGARRPDRL